MADDITAPTWASSSMPGWTIQLRPTSTSSDDARALFGAGSIAAEPDAATVRSVLEAAERGDRFAFSACARRVGGLEQARELVRNRGVLRMVDRLARAPLALIREPDRVRSDGDPEDDGRTLHGHFAVFNEWTEIDSWFEGHFLERIAPGAFKKTIRENRSEIKPLFQHGMDPQVGDKPLGPIDDLREDDVGAYYEVRLLDTTYTADLIPGLRAGLYGASFRFQTIREDMVNKPDASESNPKGLPERTLKELRLFEFGPVTFPAYPAATAAVREAPTPPQESAETATHPDASVGAGSPDHPALGRRGQSVHTLTRKEQPSWRL